MDFNKEEWEPRSLAPNNRVKINDGELEIFERVYNYLEDRRERVLTGKINCIPWGMPRLEKEIPGIEQKKMYGITANQKVK